jgi:hypothetical protein
MKEKEATMKPRKTMLARLIAVLSAALLGGTANQLSAAAAAAPTPATGVAMAKEHLVILQGDTPSESGVHGTPPFSPPSGPATGSSNGSSNGLHRESNFLAII